MIQLRKPLQELSKPTVIQPFVKVRINHDTRTVEWSNGADFASEFLYELAQQ